MKTATYLAALLVALGSTGCAWGKHKKSPPPPAVVDLSHPATHAPATNAPTDKFVVTPDEGVSGRVTSVNENLRFVVLTFPLGQLPPVGSRMNVWRNGAIVGELKITGPERDDNSVADIVYGDTKKGDEVRPK
jgi:hypothetical protein